MAVSGLTYVQDAAGPLRELRRVAGKRDDLIAKEKAKADAAAELARRHVPRVREWQARRQTQLEGGTLRITVGHQDLVACPIEA